MTALLRALVRLYPEPFRSRFGEEIADHAIEELEHARGRSRRLVLGLATAADIVGSAVRERITPTWAGAPVADTGRRGDGTMRVWLRELRFAARALGRSPMFTATAVATLALGVGANVGIFSVVDAVLLRPLPYENQDRLVYIGASAPGSELPEEFAGSMELFFDFREQGDLIEDVGVYNWFTGSLRVDDRVERVRLSMPSPSLFSTLGAEPALGRLPTPDDEEVAVLSWVAWMDWFGGDPGVLGRSYEINERAATIVGVMGEDFFFPVEGVQAWLPVERRPDGLRPGRFGGVPLVARLAPDVDRRQLVERLTAVGRRAPDKWGGSPEYARLMERYRPVVRSLHDEIVGDARAPLLVLFGAVAIVLLIACANVTNLLLVRAQGRAREVAIRRAIGAGRAQLVRGQMAEAILLAGLAGVLAVPLAGTALPAFVAAAPEQVPGLTHAGISARSVGFAFGLCLVAALACGLAPALGAARGSIDRLRDGARGSTSRRHWGRDGLVVGQTALALVLLVGSGLLVRSFQALRGVDPGYDATNVLTFQFAPGESQGLEGARAWSRFHHDFMDALRALPGVETVGIVENVPLDEGVSSMRLRLPGSTGDGEDGPLVGRTWTAGDYFAAMGISVLRGRALAESDQTTDLGNVVVSESAAAQLWPGEDAVGQRFQWPGRDPWYTVVGVVQDVMQYSLRDDPQPLVYFPLVSPSEDLWVFTSPGFVVKSARAADLVPEVRALIREMAPSAPMYRIYTMEHLVANSMLTLSFTMTTLGVTSVLALLLGALGLYGVLSFAVAERTREIGVRMALGARAAEVRRMVVARGVRVVLAGVVVGAVAAAASTRALGGLLYGVAAVDTTTFASTALAMVLVGVLASYLPARRASAVDPIESLRGG